MDNDAMSPKPDNNIGGVGEDFVEHICSLPFGKDFLFRSPHYRTKDGDIELCDLLLLFDDTAVLMEVKTADPATKADWNDEQWANWANARINKSLTQLERGCNAIASGQVTTVANDRQGEIKIHQNEIRRLYGIAIVDHPTLDKWGKSPSVSAGEKHANVLTTTHSELLNLLEELSTPCDLTDYLHIRDTFLPNTACLALLSLTCSQRTNPIQTSSSSGLNKATSS